jgi:hypothetical protein
VWRARGQSIRTASILPDDFVDLADLDAVVSKQSLVESVVVLLNVLDGDLRRLLSDLFNTMTLVDVSVLLGFQLALKGGVRDKLERNYPFD